MTKKWIIENGEIKDTGSGMTFDSFMEIIIVLNGQSRKLRCLASKNEQLKSENKRFTWNSNEVVIDDNVTGNQLEVIDITEIEVLLDLLNRMDNELMNCRAKNTQLKLILKDIVTDLKRYDSRRMAEHIEKIANLNFKEYWE